MKRLQQPDIFWRIKYYAIEIAVVVVFLVWLTKAVWHEIGS